MTTSRQRWRQCRSMGVPWLFAGRAANQTNNLLRLHGALYSHHPPPAAPCPGGGLWCTSGGGCGCGSVAMRVVGTVCGARQTGASRSSRVSSRSHNSARTTREQRTNSARTACEQRANSGCELARNKPP